MEYGMNRDFEYVCLGPTYNGMQDQVTTSIIANI